MDTQRHRCGDPGPELVGLISTAGSAVLGLLSTASWVVAWLVVRRAPRAAWFTALPVALVLPAICTVLINLGLAFVFAGGLYLFASMSNAVMALPLLRRRDRLRGGPHAGCAAATAALVRRISITKWLRDHSKVVHPASRSIYCR